MAENITVRADDDVRMLIAELLVNPLAADLRNILADWMEDHVPLGNVARVKLPLLRKEGYFTISTTYHGENPVLSWRLKNYNSYLTNKRREESFLRVAYLNKNMVPSCCSLEYYRYRCAFPSTLGKWTCLNCHKREVQRIYRRKRASLRQAQYSSSGL